MKGQAKKLSKAEAARFFISVLGTGSGVGTWEVTPGREYAVRNGQIVYSVELTDNWPFGMKLKLSAFIGDRQIIENVLFDRDTRLPWDEEGDREKFRRVIEKSKFTNSEE